MRAKNHRCAACLEEIPIASTICPICHTPLPYTAAQRDDLIPGTVLGGHYMVGRCLGRGGFGAAYLGLELNKNKKVTIKEYFPDFACLRYPGKNEIQIKEGRQEKFDTYRKHFLSECQLLVKLKKIEGVIRYLDSFNAGGTTYLVTEYLEGETLSDRLNRTGAMPMNEALQTVYELLQVLGKVHAQGILHRDISPDNLFVWPDSAFCLIDFGSACPIDGDITGFTKGVFTAPEQRVNDKQTPSTDLYAVAVTLFTLLMGRKPEEAEGIRLECLPDRFPAQLQAVYLKATNRDPASRYQSAKEMTEALRQATGIAPGRLLLRSAQTSRSRKAPKILAALLLVLALAAAAVFLLLSPHRHEYDLSDPIPGYAATCEEAGMKETYRCKICGEMRDSEEDRLIPATGHVRADTEGITPDCTHSGTAPGVICTVCGKTLEGGEELPALGHQPYTAQSREADCVSDGVVGQTVCQRCGMELEPEHTVPALGHSAEERGRKKATCTEPGQTGEIYCTRCGEILVEGEEIPALGHEPKVLPGTEPDCTGTGLTEGIFCSRCGEVLKAQEEIPARGHTEEKLPGAEAACTEAGLTEGVVCAVCGEVLTAQEVIPPLGHDEETLPGREATCTEPGATESVVCSRCGEILLPPEEIPALGHTEETVPAREPTCTENGLTEGTVCAVCGAVLKAGDEIPATGHVPVVSESREPSCTEDGYSAATVCGVCGEVLEAEEIIPALGHTAETVPGTEATCTEEGLTDGLICSVCGEVLKAREVIPPLGHAEETLPGREASCTEAGLTDGVACSRCGEVLVPQEEIPALGHTEETVPARDPTCTEPGCTAGIRCARCGETLLQQEEIRPLGHSLTKLPARKATCTEPGSTEGTQCLVCGMILVEPREIPAPGHALDSGEITKEPSCTEEGERTKTCRRCGETVTETIPATGHIPETLPGRDPTCTENGLTEGGRCTVCGEILTPQEEIPALGHDWDEGTITTDPTCTEQGERTFICQRGDCGETRTEIMPANGHKPEPIPAKDPTCTERGLTEGSRCTVCGEILIPQEEIPPLPHTPVHHAGLIAGCDRDGYTESIVCAACGEVLRAREALPAVGHTESDVPEREASCTENGITEGVICLRCGEVLEGCEEIPPVGHDYIRHAGIMPSCTQDGYTEWSECARCGEKEEPASLPQTGHLPGEMKGTEATCSASGLSDGLICLRCGAIIKPQQEITVPHTLTFIVGTLPGCVSEGREAGEYCTVCGQWISGGGIVPAAGHLPDETGTVCQRCGMALESPAPTPGPKATTRPQAGPVVPFLSGTYPGSDAHLELSDAAGYRVYAYAGPGKSYVSVGGYKPDSQRKITVYFEENGFVLSDVLYRTAEERFVYLPKYSFDSIADIPAVSDLPFYQGVTTADLVPSWGPDSRFNAVQSLSAEKGTDVKIFFQENGFVYAEYRCGKGTVRMWLPADGIEIKGASVTLSDVPVTPAGQSLFK